MTTRTLIAKLASNIQKIEKDPVLIKQLTALTEDIKGDIKLTDMTTTFSSILTDTKEKSKVFDSRSSYQIFPIKDALAWAYYLKQGSSFWIAAEIDYTQDRIRYLKLPEELQWPIKVTLAGFAQLDNVVTKNIVYKFMIEADSIEEGMWYQIQMAIEQQHAEAYARGIREIIPTQKEREKLYNSFKHYDFMKEKRAFCEKYMSGYQHPWIKRIAFMLTEGIFFIAQFVVIFKYKSFKDIEMILPGFMKQNEFIAPEETLHAHYIADKYKRDNIKEIISRDMVLKLFEEALDIEKRFSLVYFTTDSGKKVPSEKLFKIEVLHNYIEYLGNGYLKRMGLKTVSKWNHPISSLPSWMSTYGATNKGSFYEVKEITYERFDAEVTLVKDTVVGDSGEEEEKDEFDF